MDTLTVCLVLVGVIVALYCIESQLSGIRRALERIADQQEEQ